MPGAAAGAGGGAATVGYDPKTRLTPLTVNLAEFAAKIGEENREIAEYGWFFQWDEKVRQQHNVPMGPANPQALNRYAYCLNNPLRYVDPTGHWGIEVYKRELSAEDAQRLIKALDTLSDLAFDAATLQAVVGIVAQAAPNTTVLSPASLALITGVSMEAATAIFAVLPFIAAIGAINGAATMQDLQSLRNTLADLHADDTGATITWESVMAMDRITVATQKGTISRVQLRFGPYGSFAAQAFCLWSEADWYSQGGSIW